MLSLFISDGSFGRRENEMLRRLEIGLLDEGVRVVHAVPASIAEGLGDDLTEHIVFPDAGPRLMRPFRLKRLVDQISGALPAGEVDVVHAWGGKCWVAARELAIATGAALIPEVWSGRAIDRATRFEAESARVSKGTIRGAWSVPGPAVLKAMRRHHPTWPLHACTWGVLPPEHHHHPSRDDGRPIAIAIVATGVSRRAVTVMLEGLAQAIGERTDVLIFLDEAPVARHPAVWRLIQSLKLTDRLSVVADLESRRAPTLDLDILAVPEALGEHRTIVLDAMAARCAVVAQTDPLCDYLVEGETAKLIADPTAKRWQDIFESLIADRASREALGQSASRYVARERLAHAQVEQLLSAYRAIAAAEPIPFGGE